MQKSAFSIITLLLFYCLSGFSQLPTNLKTGLIAYYPFDGSVGDSSGNSNHGSIVNATLTTDRYGNTNRAYFFNGNAYISVPSNSLLNLTGDFTISSWFNITGNTNYNAQILLSKHDGDIGSDGYVYGVWNPNNNNTNQIVNFQANNQFNTNTYPSTNGIVTQNTWYNFIASYSKADNILKYYLNGSLIMTKNIVFNVIANNLNLTIGYSRSSASTYLNYFNGKIDDVAIYSRVLSDAEAVQLYNYNYTLPIQLLSFSAKTTDNNVTLNWQTANAINFSHFELEYSSDGSNFNRLTNISTNSSNAYTYIHSSRLTNNYYRLKMVDKDRTFSYSAIEHVALAKKSLFISVYPNPVTDNSVVAITATKASKATIIVTNMAGKVISLQNKNLVVGVNNFTINSMIFIGGYYQITVATDDAKQTINVLKKITQ